MVSQHEEESTRVQSSATLTASAHQTGHRTTLAVLVFGALGVVFGDIGTSPLYTLKECLHAAGGEHASIPADLFGILSLMFWALIFVVTVKYLIFVMRADHDGEGGIFALLAIVPDRFRTSTVESGKVTGMALLAVIGAALLYGDGVITPAISVLSAVEGLKIASPRLAPLVLPLTCGILVALFAIQRRGTGDIGKLFGPVMTVWFITMAGLGIYHIIQKPEILSALSPHHGAAFFARRGIHSMLILGLGRIGGDRGRGSVCRYGPFWNPAHPSGMDVFRAAVSRFGLSGPRSKDSARSKSDGDRKPFLLARACWRFHLLTSSPFQCRHRDRVAGPDFRGVLAHSPGDASRLSPPRDDQAHRLSYRGANLHPGSEQPARSRLHFTGVDVSRVGETGGGLWHRRHWNHGDYLNSLLHRGALLMGLEQVAGGRSSAFFLAFDIPFLVANLFKFFEGGYVPMLIGAALIAGMLIWSRGRTALMEQYSSRYPTFEAAKPLIGRWLCSRVPGTAVFLAPSPDHVPPILVHHVERSRSLHEAVVLLTVQKASIPVVPAESRYQLAELGDGFYKLVISFGYMEEPLPAAGIA